MDTKMRVLEMFYCVNAEFYSSGKVLACMTSRESKTKPSNKFRQVTGMSAFKLWFASGIAAGQFLECIKNGKSDIDDALCFYSGMKDPEQKRVA